MKNIYLLKTDQKSNLYYNTNNKCFQVSEVLKDSTPFKENYFIYVTSNENLKEGVNQWYWDRVLQEPYNSGGAQYSSKQEVIVLTNDTSLIADGVQEIEKSVLISFAENPVDYVEFTKMLQVRHGVDWHDLPTQTEGRDWNGIYRHIYTLNFGEKTKKQQKSLETNKQFIENTSPEKLEELMKEFDNYEVKTLEEEAERFFNRRAKEEGFENWTQIIVQQEWEFIESLPIEFAKWQAKNETQWFNEYQEVENYIIKRIGDNFLNSTPLKYKTASEATIALLEDNWQKEKMYGEEEVIELLNSWTEASKEWGLLSKWFEKFKKK